MAWHALAIVGALVATIWVVRPAPPAEGTVAAAGSMLAPRAAHTSTLLLDGRVLIAGGMERNRVFFSSAELFDPATDAFIPTASMTVDRVVHAATALADGRVLVAGGLSVGTGPLASAELYDPPTATFVATGSLGTARNTHTATRLSDGRVLIAGGSGRDLVRLASAELYDSLTGLFTPTGDMSTPRISHTATLLRDGRVLVTGGSPLTRNQDVLRSAELYDPTMGTFTAVGEMVVGRHKHAAVALSDGTVLIVGGSDARDGGGKHTSAELFDLVSGAFTATGSMNVSRFKIPDALVLLQSGRALIAGGGAQVEVYDPATAAFTTPAGAIDRPRQFAAATVLTDARVLITGGYDENAGPSTPSAWLYVP
jgi:hypothetical protein